MKNVQQKSGLAKRLLVSAATIGLLAGGVSVVGTTTAYSQDYTTGTLDGLVRDQAGTAIANATITISSNRGVNRSSTSGSDGKFRLPLLPIGTYTVTIAAPGEEAQTFEDVVIRLGANADVAFTLETDEAVEEIFVVGQRSSGMDFNGQTTGAVIDIDEMITKVPMGRSINDVVLFAPGTQTGDSDFGSLASFSGASVAENAYYVNGMNVTNFRNFTGGSTVPFEFYRQVEVKTGGMAAEYGRAIGGFTNSVTKSGSNEFEGAVTMYYRPDFGEHHQRDINNSWNSLETEENIDVVVELSGPIVKDKLFFYGLYNYRDTSYTSYTNSTYTEYKSDDPFWGFKIDFEPFEGHRFEATMWSDERTLENTVYDFNTAGLDREEVDGSEIGALNGQGFADSGGLNQIYKYTGVITDWFTISAMYGKNEYARTTQSTADGSPLIYERMTNPASSTRLGNWVNTYAATGDDTREAYRIDADFYFEAAGDHHIRVGWDREELTATEESTLTGGEYFRYHYCTDVNGCFDGQIAYQEEYLRHLIIDSGGEFKNYQTAFYIQDSWEVTPNLTLNLGIRNETFDNRNADGETFIKVKNQWAPRLGFSWDPTGEGRHKVTGFMGRYYMPIAANTNIRMAGAELFIEEYLTHAGFANRNADDTPNGVDYDNPLQYTLSSDGTVPDVSTIKDQTIDPLKGDEFILGYQYDFDNGWRVGVNAMYRTLSTQIDDVGINHATVLWALENGYELSDVAWIMDPSQHGIDYVLTNPGTDMTVVTDLLGDELVTMNLTSELLGYEKAKRKYKALEFTFAREFDGVWDLAGSYTLSSNKGNTEGVVKSDNGQDDAGLTQDYDLVSLMDGAYGPLPTQSTHKLKIWGSYQLTDQIQIGGRLDIASPRKFGCIGVLPEGIYGDSAAANAAFQDDGSYTGSYGDLRQLYEGRYGNDYWYCGGESAERGSRLSSDWQKTLDLSVNLRPSFADDIPGDFLFRLDVFNVFNSQSVTDLDEKGEDESGVAFDTYGTPTGYETPRYIRFMAKWSF